MKTSTILSAGLSTGILSAGAAQCLKNNDHFNRITGIFLICFGFMLLAHTFIKSRSQNIIYIPNPYAPPSPEETAKFERYLSVNHYPQRPPIKKSLVGSQEQSPLFILPAELQEKITQHLLEETPRAKDIVNFSYTCKKAKELVRTIAQTLPRDTIRRSFEITGPITNPPEGFVFFSHRETFLFPEDMRIGLAIQFARLPRCDNAAGGYIRSRNLDGDVMHMYINRSTSSIDNQFHIPINSQLSFKEYEAARGLEGQIGSYICRN